MKSAARFVVCSFCLTCLAFASKGYSATLVAEWDFQPGNRAQDSSGNGNDLSTMTGVTYSTGGPNGLPVANFNGSATTVDRIAGLNNFTGLGGASYAAFVDFTNPTSGNYQGIISQDTGGCCDERLMINGSSNVFFNPGTHDDLTSLATVGTGWHQVVLTVADSGTSRSSIVYVDGVAQPALITAGNFPNGSTWSTLLGHGEGGGSSYLLTGGLADVRVYQGVLTPDQVTALLTVPEPASFILFGLAAVGLLAAVRRRKA